MKGGTTGRDPAKRKESYTDDLWNMEEGILIMYEEAQEDETEKDQKNKDEQVKQEEGIGRGANASIFRR